MSDPLAPYLDVWQLVPDGEQITTHSSLLLPVRRGVADLVLKYGVAEEERRGNRLLAHWKSAALVPLVESFGRAVLMPRAADPERLTRMAEGLGDYAATDLACACLGTLHASDAEGLPLVPLEARFQALREAPRDAFFEASRGVMNMLLAQPLGKSPLHGDMHHGNLLHFEGLGWRAIDPKGLIGERGFDYANWLCNPGRDVAFLTGRAAGRVARISQRSGIAPQRLWAWVAAWAGLSAAWSMQDGEDPRIARAIGALAMEGLG